MPSQCTYERKLLKYSLNQMYKTYKTYKKIIFIQKILSKSYWNVINVRWYKLLFVLAKFLLNNFLSQSFKVVLVPIRWQAFDKRHINRIIISFICFSYDFSWLWKQILFFNITISTNQYYLSDAMVYTDWIIKSY